MTACMSSRCGRSTSSTSSPGSLKNCCRWCRNISTAGPTRFSAARRKSSARLSRRWCWDCESSPSPRSYGARWLSSHFLSAAGNLAGGHGVAQSDRREQVYPLQPRRDVRHARARAKRKFGEIIARGQSPRIELAEDHPFGQPIDASEIQPLRQLLDSLADEALVARTERRKPVSQHDPVDDPEITNAPPAARFLDHLCIMAGAGDTEGFGIDGPEHAEIDQTVVDP